MKKFIKKTLFFLLIIFIIERIVSFFVPYHWGNPWYSTKIQFLEKKRDLFPDTYFWGSSRVYRQFNPGVFDREYKNLSGKQIYSFNLGAPATFSPQIYYLYEKFLNSDLSNNTKYVFIELMDINNIGTHLMHQERTTYWQNYNDIKFILKYLYLNTNLTIENKIRTSKNYVISYIENLFNIGQFGDFLLRSNYYKKNYLGERKDGFFPLESQLLVEDDLTVKNNLTKRKIFLKNNKKLLTRRAKESIRNQKNNNYNIGEIHIKRIEELIKMSAKKNIYIFFVLLPRTSSLTIEKIFSEISEKNKIQLSNAKNFPELYNFDNSFDVGHLNTTGSKILTCLLAQAFYEKQMQWNQ